MSRRNYIHTMDYLIGKPYSNAAGDIIDPITGTISTDNIFMPEQLPDENPNVLIDIATPPLPTLSKEEIKAGATPEVSQAEIDAAKAAQLKFNEEMGLKLAEQERLREAQRLEDIATLEARNQYAIEQNRLTDLRIAQEKADREKAEKEASDKVLAEAKKIAQIEMDKQASLNTPIVISTTNFPSMPPIIGGGGGGMGGASSSKVASVLPSKGAKPSFLKKNFIPLLLVASAIYVFIKKPIK